MASIVRKQGEGKTGAGLFSPLCSVQDGCPQSRVSQSVSVHLILVITGMPKAGLLVIPEPIQETTSTEHRSVKPQHQVSTTATNSSVLEMRKLRQDEGK